MKFRFLLMLAGLPLAGTFSATADATPPRAVPAHGVADPRALIAGVYAAYARSDNHTPPEPRYAYSPRLRGLFGSYDAWQRRHTDDVGSIDFDWWVNGQEWHVSGVRITVEPGRTPDTQAVVAHFRNLDSEETSRFLFVRQAGRWYLDDVVSGGGHGEQGWTLSALLRAPAG